LPQKQIQKLFEDIICPIEVQNLPHAPPRGGGGEFFVYGEIFGALLREALFCRFSSRGSLLKNFTGAANSTVLAADSAPLLPDVCCFE